MNLPTDSHFDLTSYIAHLKTEKIGRNTLLFRSLDSTNSFVKSLDSEILPHGCLCITDHQTAGRGQYQRSWFSEPGKNLTFSILLKPKANDRTQLLLQVCALSLVDAIQEITGLQVWMKWPNDLYVGHQKVCGILAESTFTGKSLDRMIIGIGLNVNSDEYTLNKAGNAVSLKLLIQHELSKEYILAQFMNRLESYYERWVISDEDLVRQINHLYPCLGKTVTIMVDGVQTHQNFKFLGLDIDGYPLFLDESLSLKKFVHEQIRFGL